jgi:hypothetical protein
VRLPAEDLESCPWLRLWTLLSIGRHKDDLSQTEKRWFTRLEAARDYVASIEAKAVILSEMERSVKVNELTNYPIRKEGYHLFRAWFNICDEHRMFVLTSGSLNIRNGSARSKSEVIEEELDKLYMKFIEKGVEYVGGNKSSVIDDVSTPMEE